MEKYKAVEKFCVGKLIDAPAFLDSGLAVPDSLLDSVPLRVEIVSAPAKLELEPGTEVLVSGPTMELLPDVNAKQTLMFFEPYKILCEVVKAKNKVGEDIPCETLNCPNNGEYRPTKGKYLCLYHFSQS